MEEIKKSYNPFRMWGSWLGFILGILVISSSYLSNHVVFLHPFAWAYYLGAETDWEGLGILAVLTMPIIFFIYGWLIHFFFRKISKENPLIIFIIILMLVVLPYTYGTLKDKLTFQKTLNSADSIIYSAKAVSAEKRTSDDLYRESKAMNAIMVMSQAEKDISQFTNEMFVIASDESVAIDVRLTAIEVLVPKVGMMNQVQKKNLSEQLLSLSNKVNKSSQMPLVDKERMNMRITNLQNVLTSKINL